MDDGIFKALDFQEMSIINAQSHPITFEESFFFPERSVLTVLTGVSKLTLLSCVIALFSSIKSSAAFYLISKDGQRDSFI